MIRTRHSTPIAASAPASAGALRARLAGVALALAAAAGLGLGVVVASTAKEEEPVAVPTPPVAARKPVTVEAHGDKRVDPYAWLRDDERESEEVLGYLEAERAYAEAYMAPAKPLQEALLAEIIGRIQEDDESVPYPDGRYVYWERTEKGKQYPVYLRRRALHPAEAAREPPVEVVLDLNAAAEGHDFYDTEALEPSPDGSLLAFLEDTVGQERYTLRFRNLVTGETLADAVEEVGDVCWATDGKTVLYALLDPQNRPYKVMLHVLGAPVAEDRLVYEETDEQFWVELYRTRSDRLIVIACGSQDTSDARIIPADAPATAPVQVRPRRDGIEDEVDHHGEHLYVRTDEDAIDFRLLRAPLAGFLPPPAAAAGSGAAPTPAPAPKAPVWETVLPHRPGTLLENVDLFERFLVAYERTDGVQQIRVRDLAKGEDHLVSFDEPCYSIESGPNEVFATTKLRFELSTLTTPPAVYDYDLATRERVVLKRHVAHGWDPKAYEARRIHATSPDGTRVPISLVMKRGLALDGKAPCYLTGYGAYGLPTDPYFSWTRASLLERGFVFAIAHIRGGGDLGRSWYEAGKLREKKNTFIDFIACAEELCRQKITSPERLVIRGASAGGLLMGAVINLRPELFRIVIADVPFVDVINTMSDPTIPLTVVEYDEWGNPADRSAYEAIRAYSPYDNVRAQAYPTMLVTAGLHDTRVGYWEPAKWVAKLRATRTDKHPLLLVTDLDSGHGGASGRYDAYAEYAFEYAFILRELGWPVPGAATPGR